MSDHHIYLLSSPEIDLNAPAITTAPASSISIEQHLEAMRKDMHYSNALRDRGHRLFSYYLMHSLLNGCRDVKTLYQEVSLAVRDKSQELGGTNRQDPVLACKGRRETILRRVQRQPSR